MAIEICKLPAGSTVLRKAGAEDLIAGKFTRILLVQEQDGHSYWVHFGGMKEAVTPPLEAQLAEVREILEAPYDDSQPLTGRQTIIRGQK